MCRNVPFPTQKMRFSDKGFFWARNLFPRVAFAPEGRLCFPSEARGVKKTQGCKGRPWKKGLFAQKDPLSGNLIFESRNGTFSHF